MADPRVFISFDFDHDETEKNLFVGQSKNSKTPFSIEDWSSKSSLPQAQWEALIKGKINKCNMLIVLSVGNVLVMAERRNRITEAQGRYFTELQTSLPIHLADTHTRQLWGGAVAVVRSHGLSVYGGACLDLAMRKGLPLATLDNALKDAARAVGMDILLSTRPPSPHGEWEIARQQ